MTVNGEDDGSNKRSKNRRKGRVDDDSDISSDSDAFTEKPPVSSRRRGNKRVSDNQRGVLARLGIAERKGDKRGVGGDNIEVKDGDKEGGGGEETEEEERGEPLENQSGDLNIHEGNDSTFDSSSVLDSADTNSIEENENESEEASRTKASLDKDEEASHTKSSTNNR